jgi:hypothetical protein
MGRSRSRSPRLDRAVEMDGVRTEKEVAEDKLRIKRLLVTAGDERAKVKGVINGLCVLEDDLDDYMEFIVDTTLECASQLPAKPGVYASWTAKMRSSGSQTFVDSLVEKTCKKLVDALGKGRYEEATLVLRFMLELVNTRTIEADPVLRILQQLVAAGDNDAGPYVVVRALPFVGTLTLAEKAAEVDALIAAAAAHVAKRGVEWHVAVRLSAKLPSADRLQQGVAALQQLKAGGFKSEVITRHSELFLEEWKASTPGPLPDVTLPTLEPMMAPVTAELPLDNAAAMPKHERWLLEDLIESVLLAFGQALNQCAKEILLIPYLHPMFDRVLAETVMLLALRLPNPPHVPIFYMRVLQTVTQLQASVSVPYTALLAYFTNRVEELDSETADALSEHLTLFLACRNFEFPWEDVAGSVSPQKARFLRRTLDKLQRISFHDNLKQRLPNALQEYVPEEPKPLEDFAVPAEEFDGLAQFVRIKDPQEDAVTDYLTRLSSSGMSDESWTPARVMELFAYALLRSGAKTPTHWARLLEGHVRIFETLLSKDPTVAQAQRVAIVRSVFLFWAKSPHRLEATIDSLLLRGVLDAVSVATYILNEQSATDADAAHNQNLLHSVVRKALEKAALVQADLASAQRLNRTDAVSAIQETVDKVNAETAETFLRIFRGFAAQYGSTEDKLLKEYAVGRFLSFGRRYHRFVRPFLDQIEALELPPVLQPVAKSFRAIS